MPASPACSACACLRGHKMQPRGGGPPRPGSVRARREAIALAIAAAWGGRWALPPSAMPQAPRPPSRVRPRPSESRADGGRMVGGWRRRISGIGPCSCVVPQVPGLAGVLRAPKPRVSTRACSNFVCLECLSIDLHHFPPLLMQLGHRQFSMSCRRVTPTHLPWNQSLQPSHSTINPSKGPGSGLGLGIPS